MHWRSFVYVQRPWSVCVLCGFWAVTLKGRGNSAWWVSSVRFAQPFKGKAQSKQGLSKWLVPAIGMALSTMGRTSQLDVPAHSTRGMATLWAFSRGFSVSEICAGASQATPHTLMPFYRLDVTVPTVVQAVMGVVNSEKRKAYQPFFGLCAVLSMGQLDTSPIGRSSPD